jgi:uncharacterized caspase-like protein
MMEGKRYAILIGNGKYPKDTRLRPLRCPEKDVDDLEKVLKSKEYGDFTEVSVLKDVPHYESEAMLLQVLRSARTEDLVLIYYSGHGKLGLEGDLHLATVNTNIDTLEATSIPADRIRGFLRASPTRKVILILDCCYSGKVGEAFLKGGGVEDQLAQIQSERQGIYILTASSGLEVAQEKPEDQNSLLTKHILEGIKEGRADFDDKGSVSIGDLYRYSWDQMKKADFQAPMKWDLNVRGDDLVVASTGKASGEKRRKQTREVLFELARDESLPSAIVTKAMEILELKKDQLSEAQASYCNLLDRLVQKSLNVTEFVFQWQTIGLRIEHELRRKEMKALYGKAKDARSTGDWSLVVDNLQTLLALDPTYGDAPELLEEAQQKLKYWKLYVTGKEHHKQSRWAEALEALMQVQSNLGDYEDATSLIRTAQDALAVETAKAQQQAEVDTLYLEASSLISTRDWKSAFKKLQAILEIVPDNEAASQKLIEVRQTQLEDLYDQGKKLYESEQYQEAITYFQQVAEIDGDYREIKILREKAEESERLKREAEENKKKTVDNRLRIAPAWGSAFLTISIFSVSLTGVALIFGLLDGARGISLELILTRAINISLIYSVPVACAILPKTRWSFARVEVGDVRPLGFYLVAGLLAAGISQLISLVFNIIFMLRVDWAWQRSRLIYPWLVVSFATALITASMVDNPPLLGMSRRWQQCREGLVQGALMLPVTALTYLWLYQRLVDFKRVNLDYLNYQLIAPIPTMVIGAVVGFVIGFFFPNWYRRHQEQSAEEARAG